MLQLVIFAPLVGAFISGILISAGLMRRLFCVSRDFEEKAAGLVGSIAVLVSAICATVLAFGIFSGAGETRVEIFEWFSSGALSVSFGFVFDRLSAVLTLVITWVGFVIHLYSIGYMAGDRAVARYFALVNLFIFFMLTLVLGGDFAVMFAGWEGVGFVSYLLIGFWFDDTEKADAGRKAFVVNRIGDFGFLIGIFLVFITFGSLEFSEISPAAADVSAGMLTVICLLLFVGAAGKSAQFPLYVWLPDAMAGPTPVSALIHAATMVTAGIYMLARCSFMYSASPDAQFVVLTVAVLTSLIAAYIAVTQTDIKKVLAYSTVSQLGFMFMAAGAGAFGVAVFHLVTHAFFKALLFLGAGAVIHSLGGLQDIRSMGGLRGKIPVTAFTFLAGTLAISGVPFFSGFFSKDSILAAVYDGGFIFHWIAAVFAAMLTAFYMTRLYVLVFEGKNNTPPETFSGIHEPPRVMTAPLIFLALLSVFGGLFSVPHFMEGFVPVKEEILTHFLKPVTAAFSPAPDVLFGISHAGLAVISTVAALAGLFTALLIYGTKMRFRDLLLGFRTILSLRSFSQSKILLDEFYHSVFIVPFGHFSTELAKFDLLVVDGAVNAVAGAVKKLAGFFSLFQTGFVRAYTAAMAAFIILLIFAALSF